MLIETHQCPKCGGTTHHNSLISYENGFGEVRTCNNCGYTYDADARSDEDLDDEDQQDPGLDLRDLTSRS